MLAAVNCPPPDNLRLLASGRLSARETIEAESHLSVCDSCRAGYDALISDFVDVLRVNGDPGGPSFDDGDRKLLAEAVPQLKRLAKGDSTLESAESLETGIYQSSGGSAAAAGDRSERLDGPPAEGLPKELLDQTKYTFLRKLGGGGMGVVWLAEHNRMRRKVAVKLIPPALVGNSGLKARFLREVVSAAALEHPNVVRAYAVEEIGEHVLFEMEFVDGCDLGEVVKRAGPLSVKEAVDCIRQAALGLQQAKLMSMVHRDIKPGNLIRTANGTVKVADFGLAKFGLESDKNEGDSLTGDHVIMGTPAYMAPEQARNAKSADIRADIYSLGCTFHYLLAGKPPYAGESATDLILKHGVEGVPDICGQRPDVPAELGRYIRRMLAKDAGERPQTPQQVVDDLARIDTPADGAHPSIPQPGKSEPAAPPIRRRGPAKWIAAIAGLCAAIAAGIVVELKNRDGTLVVETDIPNPTVKVLGEDHLSIETQDGGKKVLIRLKRGKDYQVVLEKDGFEAAGRRFR